MKNKQRVAESELVIPALIIMASRDNGEVATSDLIEALEKVFEPCDEDMEILEGRNDTKFSQKVRNLKSHKTIKTKGLAEEIDGGFRITDKGKEYIRKQLDEKN